MRSRLFPKDLPPTHAMRRIFAFIRLWAISYVLIFWCGVCPRPHNRRHGQRPVFSRGMGR